PTEEYLPLMIKSTKWPKGLSETDRKSAIANMNTLLDVSFPRMTALAKVLNGKTIGLFGFGPIGVAVAEKLQKIKEKLGIEFEVVSYTRAFNDISHPDHNSRLELAKKL